MLKKATSQFHFDMFAFLWEGRVRLNYQLLFRTWAPLSKKKSKTTPKKMAEVELREGHESVTCAAMLEIISWGHQSNCLVKPFFLFLLSHNPFLAWQISFTSYLYKSHPPPPIHELLEKMCGHRKRGPDKTDSSLDIDYLLCWLAIISSPVL